MSDEKRIRAECEAMIAETKREIDALVAKIRRSSKDMGEHVRAKRRETLRWN